MAEVGQPAPDFELPDQNGEPVRLSDFRGQRVVVYFYPKADTPGCTTQACGIRDHTADYDAAGAEVLAELDRADYDGRRIRGYGREQPPFTGLAYFEARRR